MVRDEFLHRVAFAVTQFLTLGLRHGHSQLERWQTVLSREEALRAFMIAVAAHPTVEGIACLVTCNRAEFFAVAEDGAEAVRLIAERLAAELELPTGDADIRFGEEAMGHLFRVAAGLDSRIPGETQIMGQIRRAREISRDAGTLNLELDAIMLEALETGQRVRRDTGIARGNISVGSLTIELMRQTFQEIQDRRVLLIGAGETAQIVARHLHKNEVSRVTILNRTAGRAAMLANSIGAEHGGLSELTHAVAESDVVICAANSDGYILASENFPAYIHDKTLVVDLSRPGGVDPTVGEIAKVRFHTLSDVESIAERVMSRRLEDFEKAEKIVSEDVQAFLDRSETERLNGGLRRRVEEIRRAHLERYAKRLSAVEREMFSQYGESLLRAVLHDLTRNLRSIDPRSESGTRDLEILRELFEVNDSEWP